MECFLYLARKTVNSEPKVVSCLLCASPIHAQNRHNFRLERMKRGERKKGNPLNDPDRKKGSSSATVGRHGRNHVPAGTFGVAPESVVL